MDILSDSDDSLLSQTIVDEIYPQLDVYVPLNASSDFNPRTSAAIRQTQLLGKECQKRDVQIET